MNSGPPQILMCSPGVKILASNTTFHKKKKKHSLLFLCFYDLRQEIAEGLKLTNEREIKKTTILGFPGGTVVENLPANAGDTGSSPGLGRSHMPHSN